MNQIIIAKKVSFENVEFLDFAVNDDDKLLVFSKFADASKFLKQEVGESEELLKYIITTVEAHRDNPRMQEALSKGIVEAGLEKEESALVLEEYAPDLDSVSQVECYFLLDCENYQISNNDSIIDRTTGKQLVPVLAFVDATNPNELVQVPHFKLTYSFIGDVNPSVE